MINKRSKQNGGGHIKMKILHDILVSVKSLEKDQHKSKSY